MAIQVTGHFQTASFGILRLFTVVKSCGRKSIWKSMPDCTALNYYKTRKESGNNCPNLILENAKINVLGHKNVSVPIDLLLLILLWKIASFTTYRIMISEKNTFTECGW